MKIYHYGNYREWEALSEDERRKEWKTATDEEKVHLIKARDDSIRLDSSGGYPDDWTIENGRVYVATMDPGKSYNAPLLEISRVEDLIAEYEDEVLEPV